MTNFSNRKISISEYQHTWADDFQALSSWYLSEFADKVIAIHHVGSTSVPEMVAKPRIDIDIEVNETNFPLVKQALNSLKYEYVGDLGIPDRYAFKYAGSRDLPRHNLYLCLENTDELRRHLVFRDYLRTHPEAVKEYSSIKREAFDNGSDHIVEYMDYKGPIVTKLLVKAMYWADVVPTPPNSIYCDDCEEEAEYRFNIAYLGNGDKEERFEYSCSICDNFWYVPI